MAPQTNDPPGVQSPDPSTEGAPDLVALADTLARKHQASATSDGRVRSGRRSADVEAQAWLDRNGLRAIPVTSPSPGGPPLGSPPPAGPGLGPDPGPPPGYVVDPAFVRTLAESALKGIEAYRQRAVFLKALSIGADTDLARELGDGNGAPPGAIPVMSMCLAEISQKYGWLAAWSPEVGLVVAAGAWFAKDMATMQRLERIRRQVAADATAAAPKEKAA